MMTVLNETLLIFATAASQVAAAPTAPAPSLKPPYAEPKLRAVPLRRDRKGRPMIGVEVNGNGPFAMIVDTAAQTSLVTASLATELGLPKLDGGLGINGATGVTQAELFGVKRLSSGLFDIRDSAMPMLANSGVTDARGIIGMDVAVGRKLIFDAQAGMLDIAPSGPPSAGFVLIRGRINDVGLIVVPVMINGHRVDALIDSGSEGVIASEDLLRLLGWADTDPRLKVYGTMRGAGGESHAVRTAALETLQLGPIRLSNVPVIFAGTHAHDSGSTPQIVLGVNVLNMLSAYALDFGRAELQIRIPSPAAKAS